MKSSNETQFIKFMEHFTINKIDVYGNASDELKEFVKPFGLPYYFHKPYVLSLVEVKNAHFKF